MWYQGGEGALILARRLWEIPNLECVNLHAAMVPWENGSDQTSLIEVPLKPPCTSQYYCIEGLKRGL